MNKLTKFALIAMLGVFVIACNKEDDNLSNVDNPSNIDNPNNTDDKNTVKAIDPEIYLPGASVVTLSELDKYLSNIDLSRIKLRINDVDDSNITELAKILMEHNDLANRISLDLTFCEGLTQMKDNLFNFSTSVPLIYLMDENKVVKISEDAISYLDYKEQTQKGGSFVVPESMIDKYYESSFGYFEKYKLYLSKVNINGRDTIFYYNDEIVLPTSVDNFVPKEGFSMRWRQYVKSVTWEGWTFVEPDSKIYTRSQAEYTFVPGYWSDINLNTLNDYLKDKSGELTLTISGYMQNTYWSINNILRNNENCIYNIVIPQTDYITVFPAYGMCCPRAKSFVIPEGVEELDNQYSILEECNILEKIELPSTLKSLKYIAGFPFLKSLDIPEGVTTIVDGTFQFTLSLESVILRSKQVVEIGKDIFDGRDTKSFSNILLNDRIPEEYVNRIKAALSANVTTTIYVPSDLLIKYKEKYPELQFQAIK